MKHATNMKRYIVMLLMMTAAVTYTAQPVMAATLTPQEQKAKEKAKAQKAKEKAKAQAAKEKAKAQAAKEKEKAQAAKEKEKAQAEKEKEKAQAAKEKEKEQAQRMKEKEAADRERAAVAAARIEKMQRDSAAKAQAAEKERQAYYKQQAELTNPKVTATHYINLAPRLGYSLFMNRPEGATHDYKGGVGGGLQLSYMLEYKHLLFETGLAFDILSSKSNYTGVNALRDGNDFRTGNFKGTVPATGAQFRYMSNNLSESVMAGYASLPVMIGGEWDPFYFLVGARINYGVFASYKQSGAYDLNVTGDGGIAGSNYTVSKYIQVPEADDSKYKMKAIDVRVAAEVGLDLDKWLQKQPDKKKAKVKPGERYPFGREHMHYKVALFAEYGVLNNNNNSTANTLNFADKLEPTTGHTVMAQNGAKQNNLFVGAKFVFGFEIPGKKPAVVPAPPSYVKVEVQDAETGEPIQGAQALVENTASHRTVMNKRTTNKAQLQKLPIGEYVLDVQADGYYGQSQAFHIDSIDQTIPMRILMRKIPKPVVKPVIPEVVVKEEVYILKDMYFATNKTEILPVSEPVLTSLADHLKSHQDIRIMIIGHTDNVGRDKANLKLSKGRAKSVMDALIERGVDASRLEYDGKGESEPIDTNETEEGRQHNRRVEIKIL